MKLKTTIYGKSSTLIGTPEEVAEFLEVARKKALRRAVDALPQPAQKSELHEGLRVGPAFCAQRFAENVRKSAATYKPFKPTFNAIGQTREEIVKEAIADVAELLGRTYNSVRAHEVVDHVGSIVDFTLEDRIDFFINKNKRVVAAKVWVEESTGFAKEASYATTGIARCAPSDVFNEHVGKAIALRRALGLPVPTKYYEVGGIAPEGKQVGDVAIYTSGIDGESKVNVVEGHACAVRGGEIGVLTSLAVHAKVIDDSARYVAPSTPAAKVVYVD